MNTLNFRLTTPDILRAGLEDIRRRRRLLWIVFWTYLPMMVLLFGFLGR
jgi:hypothetical protein